MDTTNKPYRFRFRSIPKPRPKQKESQAYGKKRETLKYPYFPPISLPISPKANAQSSCLRFYSGYPYLVLAIWTAFACCQRQILIRLFEHIVYFCGGGGGGGGGFTLLTVAVALALGEHNFLSICKLTDRSQLPSDPSLRRSDTDWQKLRVGEKATEAFL